MGSTRQRKREPESDTPPPAAKKAKVAEKDPDRNKVSGADGRLGQKAKNDK